MRGQVLPQTGQQNGHSGPWAGSCIREASRTRHFPARPPSLWSPDAPDTLLARSRAGPALPARLCWAWHSRGHWDVPRWLFPSSLPHKAHGMSLHVPPCPAAHTSHCVQKPGEEGDRSNVRRPGDCVHHSKHQPREVGPKLSSAMFGLQLDSVLRVFPIPEDSVTVQLTSALTLCSPSSPPPDQNQVQGWVLPAPTDTIRSGPVLLCWAQTSGPAG